MITFNRQYQVRCQSDVSGIITAITNNTQILFRKSDGVVGDVQYRCSVALVLPSSEVSGYSFPGVITTLAPVVAANTTIKADDIILPVSYYDFK